MGPTFGILNLRLRKFYLKCFCLTFIKKLYHSKQCLASRWSLARCSFYIIQAPQSGFLFGLILARGDISSNPLYASRRLFIWWPHVIHFPTMIGHVPRESLFTGLPCMFYLLRGGFLFLISTRRACDVDILWGKFLSIVLCKVNLVVSFCPSRWILRLVILLFSSVVLRNALCPVHLSLVT